MSNIEQSTEEEISLIDLFAVLVRFRKMIVLGTVICSFICALVLFVCPKFISSLDKREVEAVYSVKINQLPSTITTGFNKLGLVITPEKVLFYSFEDLPFVARQYKEAQFMGGVIPSDERLYNTYISRLVSKKVITVKTSIMAGTYDVKIKMSVNNIDLGLKFVSDIIAIDNESVRKTVMDSLPLIEKNTVDSLEKIENSRAQVNDLTAIQNLRDTLNDIRVYREKNEDVFQIMGNPFVISVAQGRVKKLMIFAFAAFFIFVFIAFARNAVANIKNDPEASKILSDAWKAGK